MAAAVELVTPKLRDLAGVTVEKLAPLLEEEIAVWRRVLDWDFQAPAGLVRRYLESGALTGYVLEADQRLVGYAYFVAEPPKCLLGDLFLSEGYWTPDHERLLLATVVGASMRSRGVHRIEAQLMLLRNADQGPLPGADCLASYPRYLMLADLAHTRRLPPRPIDRFALIDRWSEARQDDAAQLIAAAYQGHIDSLINDQYRTPAGARRFLFNIVQYPGCGAFFPPACMLALERSTGTLCGLCLASLVSPEVGHITQICVSPSLRGQGLGYELLRRSLETLALSGAARVSLTVSVANESAVSLYRRLGFSVLRSFPALVWSGF